MSSGITANGKTLEQTFAAYSGGAKAANTGISGGAAGELSNQFDPLSAGSAAAATGIGAPAGDLNVYFAALGTTSLLPGIQGLTMSTAVHVSGASGTAQTTFTATTSGWSFASGGSGGGLTPVNLPQSGTLPTGATQVQVTATLSSGVAGTPLNTASSITAITSGGVGFQIGSTGAATPGNISQYTLVIKFYNASSVLLSTTTCTLIASHGS